MPAFRYQSFDNTPYVQSASDLMQAPARAQAQAALASGQAWAGAANQIGQSIAAIPQQMQQQKRMAQQDEIGAMQIGETKRAITARDTFAKIIRETPQMDEDGVSLYDIPTVAKQLAAAGQDPGAAVEHLGKINDAFRQEKAAKMALVKTGAASIAASGNDPVLAGHFLDQLEKNGTYPKDQVSQFREFIRADPGNTEKLTAYLMGPQKMENAAPGSMARNPMTGQVVPGSAVPEARKTQAELAADAANPNSPTQAQSTTAIDLLRPPKEAPKPPAVGTFEDYVVRKFGPNPTPQQVEQARKAYGDAGRVSVTVGGGGMNAMYNATDPKAIADAIMRGDREPETGSLGRPIGAAVDSVLAKAGYNKAGALTDWKATQKHIATMNGAQQLRLNQAINALPEMLDSVEALASKWKGGKFPVLNKANLALAKGGAYGQDVASVANQLDAQIADVTADLGNVYMGGNSPTDHALSLAGKSLKGEWSEKVLKDMIGLARKNVSIRRNSINSTGVAGASPGNPYAAGGPPAAGAVGTAVTVAAPNGKSYTFKSQADADAFKVKAGIK